MKESTFLYERPRGGERAVLVHVDFAAERDREGLEEFQGLVASAGATAVALVRGRRRAPDPRYLVGSGKVEEIAAAVEAHQGEVVIFNHALTPSQERNLEQRLRCRVLDRTTLILDIFAQRARSHEGKLQVELAQLRHLATRLVRGWTHLERQKGGIGLRGPGETQLETDRRLIGERIEVLRRRLERVRRQRAQGRRARQRAAVPTVSLVGYTNAGKSTLFNRLTQAGVYAADQLFATLDPTVRRVELDRVGDVVLVDTVGFIRHLPHDLVAAFRSTLEETTEAALLLHVIDASDALRDEAAAQVREVLREIGADAIPQIEVMNKIDRLGLEPHLDRDAAGKVRRVWLSAATGAGLELLRAALVERLRGEERAGWLGLGPGDGRLRARLYGLGAVRRELTRPDGGWLLEVRLPVAMAERLERREGFRLRWEPAATRPADALAASGGAT